MEKMELRFQSNKTYFTDDKLEKENNTYIAMYKRLFQIAMLFERLHGKDLYSFTRNDLLTMFSSVAKDFRYNTIVTFNSLVSNYKDWAINKGYPAIADTCTIDELKSIDNYKQYVILTEDDILNITEDLVMDGMDYMPVAFIRLFWEIDGQESVKDVLSIKIDDLNEYHNTIKINNREYKISQWLRDFLIAYAELDYLTFTKGGKHGRYPILPAIANDGYIFRMMYNKRTNVGEPMKMAQFSNAMCSFGKNNLTEQVTVDDLLMSMALRHMVTYKKSHTQMFTQKMYFKNMPSTVFAEVFKNYAEEFYPNEYKTYLLHYQMLDKKYNCC
jgi:hypothetical protein